MNVFGDLPSWAVVLLAVLAAGVLLLLNVGWLLQAKGMLEQMAQKRQERERQTGGDEETGDRGSEGRRQ